MKKIIGFILLFACFTASAQYTTPRNAYGTYKYNENKKNYVYTTLVDAPSSTIDTLAITPNAYITTYKMVLVDSVCLGNPTVTNCYLGDRIQIILSAASGTPFCRFIGANWITAGTATMTTRLRSVIELVFDGAKWVETSRYTQ